MSQQPGVRLRIHPSFFDLLISILQENANNGIDDHIRNTAKDLIDKRMRFSRRYPSNDGGEDIISIRMYEGEAAEMIWQLLLACAANYDIGHEYSLELKDSSSGMIPV